MNRALDALAAYVVRAAILAAVVCWILAAVVTVTAPAWILGAILFGLMSNPAH